MLDKPYYRIWLHFNHHLMQKERKIHLNCTCFADVGNLTLAACPASEYPIHYSMASLHEIPVGKLFCFCHSIFKNHSF